MRRIDVAIAVLGLLLVISLLLWLTSGPNGVQLQPAPQSKVQIQVATSIDLSPELLAGIDFGTASPPVLNLNGTKNFAGPGTATMYAVNRSIFSTVDVTVCIHASANLTSGPFAIDILGETWSNNTNPLSPALPGKPLTVNRVIASSIMTAANPTTNYRFWLDIPNPGQQAGTYTNTIFFEAQQAGGALC